MIGPVLRWWHERAARQQREEQAAHEAAVRQLAEQRDGYMAWLLELRRQVEAIWPERELWTIRDGRLVRKAELPGDQRCNPWR